MKYRRAAQGAATQAATCPTAVSGEAGKSTATTRRCFFFFSLTGSSSTPHVPSIRVRLSLPSTLLILVLTHFACHTPATQPTRSLICFRAFNVNNTCTNLTTEGPGAFHFCTLPDRKNRYVLAHMTCTSNWHAPTYTLSISKLLSITRRNTQCNRAN